ncbi:hypothetical protein QE152_g13710 [Popillia japonica]|uniref:Reverse transcriptase domain-containing protein n=1 Tax=Popillia japonica TaxID=7064 RepID=A0AAW1LBW3_POPJA
MLLELPGLDLLTNDSTQQIYSEFHNNFMAMFNACFPETRKRVSYNPRTKWVNCELKNTKNRLDALSTVYRATKDASVLQIYNEHKKQYQRATETCKWLYNEKLIHRSANKQQTVWSIINRETGKNMRSTTPNSSNLTAESLNKFFVSVEENVIKQIDKSNLESEALVRRMDKSPRRTCFLGPVDACEVEGIVSTCKSKKIKDIYGMRAELLKRMQAVSWKGRLSERRPVRHGVAQGSILAPLLFIIYQKGGRSDMVLHKDRYWLHSCS